jgi:glycosyltransferase involved in cell wall biosynthesis
VTTTRSVVLWAFMSHPQFGSEGGLGWNWARVLARRGLDVHLVTMPTHRSALERALSDEPPGLGINVHFTRGSSGAFDRGQQGKLAFYLDYLRWQGDALAESRRLGLDGVDVAHHVSWGAVLLGSRLAQLGPPLVFGPAGGGQLSGRELRGLLGRVTLRDSLRSLAVQHLAPALPTTRGTFPKARLTLVANRPTECLARRLGAGRVEAMIPEGIDEDLLARAPRRSPRARSPLVLWVSRFAPHKAAPLAVLAFARLRERLPDARLVMVGSGPTLAPTRAYVPELGQRDAVEFTGALDWTRVLSLYDEADVFVFTSIKDTWVSLVSPPGVSYATVSHSGGGGGDYLPDAGACKVSGSPADTVADRLAVAVSEILDDTDGYVARSSALLAFARQNTWDAKAARMVAWYDELVGAQK